MEQQIKHYGVNRFTVHENEFEKYSEEIRIKGYTVIEDVLNSEQLEIAKQKLAETYAKQTKEVGGDDVMAAINDIDITRALLTYDDFFLHSIAANDKVIPVIKNLLGNYFILREQNGITNQPNSPNYQLKWHRDILYQNFIISTPIAISVLFCLDDFVTETGGTYMLPATHKADAFPSETYIRANEVCANAKAGCAIAFDSMLFHRAGYNASSNKRRGINNVYALPIMRQPISLPQMLQGKYADDPFLNMLLGYDSDTDASVYEWRMRRYKRTLNK